MEKLSEILGNAGPIRLLVGGIENGSTEQERQQPGSSWMEQGSWSI